MGKLGNDSAWEAVEGSMGDGSGKMRRGLKHGKGKRESPVSGSLFPPHESLTSFLLDILLG